MCFNYYFLIWGIIRTDFSSALTDSSEKQKNIDKLVPIGRFGEAEECAGAVSFLVIFYIFINFEKRTCQYVIYILQNATHF